jgi:predicted Fe-Mo cluster-binding NifX family protein
MKVCFPVKEAQGLDSEVYGHFGSAPAFMVVDSESGDSTVLQNADAHHEHGKCSPMQALSNTPVDAVVVGGIGQGALGKLKASGVKVYKAPEATVKQAMALLKTGELVEFSPLMSCGGHSHGAGGGCTHH